MPSAQPSGSQPRFSVLIPVYNGADYLNEALQSVADQSLEGVQVIVSNNGSTDGTAAIVQSWQDKLNLKVITQSKTLPMRAHFNAALDLIDTEVYMLLCHDDYLAHPDALKLALEALDREPDVAAIYCDLLYVNVLRRKLALRKFGREGRFSADETGRASLKTARNLFGIPLGIRRRALGEMRYDDGLPYTMDIDLSWRLSQNGQAFHIAEALIANRYGNTNTTWGLLSEARSEYLKLAAKHKVSLSRIDLARLTWTNFVVTQKKRVFSRYERVMTWRG